ncbi:MAG: hypothetical protein ACOX8K_08350 [Lachnospiraceae bacterium]|jgi:uncharacterized protein (DUF3084 family)
MEMLQEYCLVALDVFRKIMYPKGKLELVTDHMDAISRECVGWLLLLTTESVKEAEELMKEYPWLEDIYEEASDQRQTPEETVWSFSEALRILDKNEAKYMIEELTAELEQERAKAEKTKIEAAKEQNRLQEQIANLQKQLEELQKS